MRDLTGLKFARIYVLSFNRMDKYRQSIWNCICDCGNKKTYVGACLVSGRSKSCGCYHKDVIRALKTTHNCTYKNNYKIWEGMMARCYKETHQAYYSYGGRGIKVCDRWLDVNNFLNDIGIRPSKLHSIDRIDNNGDYEPNNVKWSTKIEQASNRRNSKIYEVNNQRLCLSQLSRQYNIPDGTLRGRIKAGKTILEALGLDQ